MENDLSAHANVHFKKLLGLLGGHENAFPWKTAERFPHVVEKLASLWQNPPAIRAYFDQLLLTRRESREGFPLEIYTEIFSLSEFYDKQHQATKKSRDDFWTWM